MRRRALAVVGVLFVAGGSAFGHHSYGDFCLDQSKSIEGVLESLRFVDPHVVLTIRAADSTVYTATWNAARQMERRGVTRTTLKVGDYLVVTGAPPRDPTSNEVMPVWEVRRMSDGWHWSSAR
jgi:hypothetical protein